MTGDKPQAPASACGSSSHNQLTGAVRGGRPESTGEHGSGEIKDNVLKEGSYETAKERTECRLPKTEVKEWGRMRSEWEEGQGKALHWRHWAWRSFRLGWGVDRPFYALAYSSSPSLLAMILT